MNRRRFIALATFGTAAVVSGCSTMSYMNDPLVGSLTSGISGLSSTQAAGGVGSLLGMAQSKLSPADFATLTKALPNADKYMRAASDAGISLAGVKDAGSLNSAFSKLGISPEQGRSLTRGVSDWLAKNGGDAAKSVAGRALAL
jgi:hypothetical protein